MSSPARTSVSAAPAGQRAIEEVRVAERPIRNDLEIAAGRDLFEPRHGAELRREAIDFLRDERPERRLVIVRDETAEPEAPRLHAGRRESQAAERNREHREKALERDARLRRPQRVEAGVVAQRIGQDRIGLHARGVEEELVVTLAVVIGIEKHPRTKSSLNRSSRRARRERSSPRGTSQRNTA